MDENLELELTEELPAELPEGSVEDEKASLLSELESLRSRLETAERTAREISAGWREFTELYPGADMSSLPDSFNAAIEKGNRARYSARSRICTRAAPQRGKTCPHQSS